MQAVRTRTRSDPNSGTAPKTITAAPRDGVPRDAGDATAAPCAPDAPNIVRLRLVLSLVTEGKSQKEIAARIGRDPRTVRRMIAQAREMGLSVSDELLPGDAVTQVIQSFSELKADLIDLKRQAAADNNFKQQISCAKELLRIDMAFIATLDRVGIFNGFRLAPPQTIDPDMARANKLIELAQDLVSTDETDGPDDKDRANDQRSENHDPGP